MRLQCCRELSAAYRKRRESARRPAKGNGPTFHGRDQELPHPGRATCHARRPESGVSSGKTVGMTDTDRNVAMEVPARIIPGAIRVAETLRHHHLHLPGSPGSQVRSGDGPPFILRKGRRQRRTVGSVDDGRRQQGHVLHGGRIQLGPACPPGVDAVAQSGGVREVLQLDVKSAIPCALPGGPRRRNRRSSLSAGGASRSSGTVPRHVKKQRRRSSHRSGQRMGSDLGLYRRKSRPGGRRAIADRGWKVWPRA